MTRLCELRSPHPATYENAMHMQQKLVALRHTDSMPD